MRPVQTARSNVVYMAPPHAPDVADLHCERLQPGVIRSVWVPDADERRLIAQGANVALWSFVEPHPVVQLEVTEDQGVGEDAPEARARLEQLKRAPTVRPLGPGIGRGDPDPTSGRPPE